MLTTANILRPAVTTDFTALPNALFRYNRHYSGLKPRDSAVLNYLLSLPPQWKLRASDIANAVNIGKSTVYTALRRLQDLGFASYTRDKTGETFWRISVPDTPASPAISPRVKKPHVVFEHVLETNNLLQNNQKTTNDVVDFRQNECHITDNAMLEKITLGKLTIEQISSFQTATSAVLSDHIIQTQRKESADLLDSELQSVTELDEKSRILAKKTLSKIDDTNTQSIVLMMLKAALQKGGVKSPLGYLNALIHKSQAGELDISSFDPQSAQNSTMNAPLSDFERQAKRSEVIGHVFSKHTHKVKEDLNKQGYIFIERVGVVSKSEFETLGLIEKAPRTAKSSLKEIMELAEAQEVMEQKAREQAALRRKQQARNQPREVSDVKVGMMSEKEREARAKILELEAQLIAAGEFVGVNENAIGKDELAGLAAMQVPIMVGEFEA
jgi:Fe2+ or Zn2+ uptake regulation protein